MIQWFPGHMATARDEMRRAMPSVDLVIEVLDARIPFSSENPLVAAIRGDKPSIKVLNKCDLADPALTAAWLASLNATPGQRAVAHHRQLAGLRPTVMELVRRLAPPIHERPLAAMILGIPNVGKSTLINTLLGRSLTKTANKPAITQKQQRVKISRELVLIDTPGFLWPKLVPEVCAYRLAVTGAISERVVNYQELAAFLADFLRQRYPDAAAPFYGLDSLPVEDEALLEAVGRRRGYVGRGGVVDVERAAERFILDYRAGSFGPMTLESPSEFASVDSTASRSSL